MFLSEIFDQLTYGELAGLALGGIESNGIQPKDFPRIIANINAGLIKLYSEFALKTSVVKIQLYSAVTTYKLHSDYAQSTNVSVPYKYILDLNTTPFTDTLLLIDNVFNSEGVEYPINEATDPYTVYTPTYDTLEVPFAEDDLILDVYYRDSPDLIDPVGIDPMTTWVPLPRQLLESLIAFVLHKIHSSLGSGENGSEAGMFYNKYLKEMQMVKDRGLNIREANVNSKLTGRGFP